MQQFIYVIGIVVILSVSLDCSAQQIEIEVSGGGSTIFSDIDLSQIDNQLELSDGYHIQSNINLWNDGFPLYFQFSMMWNSFVTKHQYDDFLAQSPFLDHIYPSNSFTKISIQTVSLGIGVGGRYAAPDTKVTVFAGVALLNTYFYKTNITIDYYADPQLELPMVYEPPDFVVQSPLENEWRLGVAINLGTYIHLSQKLSLEMSGSYKILNHQKRNIVKTADFTGYYFPEPDLTIGQLSLGVLYQLYK